MKAGWVKTTLGDVATIQSGSGFAEKHQGHKDQTIPFYKVSDMNIVGNEREMVHANNTISEATRIELRASVFPKGSTIFPKIGGAIATNKKRLTTKDCCVDNNVMGVIPKEGKIDSTYLYYFFQSFDLSEFANEAHLPSIKKTVVAGWPIHAPLALAEQHRIVGILDQAFDDIALARANAEKNLKNARALFESHLQAVFTQWGEDWIVKPVSEIAQHSLGKMLDKAKNKGKPRSYLRNLNVRWFDFNLNDLLEMRFTDDELQKYSVVRGDVVICEGGYPGRAAIWDKNEPIYFQKALHRVRFHQSEHNKWFLYYLYSQERGGNLRQYFTGSGIQHFTGAALSRLQVPLAPLREITKRVTEFDTLREEIQRLESLYQRKLTALDELKESLLHQAFSGAL